MSPFYRCSRCFAESTHSAPLPEHMLVCEVTVDVFGHRSDEPTPRRWRQRCGGQLVLTATTPAVAAGGA